jgi:threonine dehydratase
MSDWTVPTFADVLAARRRIAAHLRPTPLFRYPALDDLLGTDVHVKHENHQPVGAFKVRGGVNLVAQLSDDERERGLIGASTGNHGQSLAFASRRFGVTARICVPERANPVKLAAMKGLGAELIVRGADFDDARENAERLAGEHGYRYVHSGDEPHLIAGVATETLEILEEQPDVDVVVVPVGGGSGAAGACIVAKAINPAIAGSRCSRTPHPPPTAAGRRARRWRPIAVHRPRAWPRALPSRSRSRSCANTSTTSCSSARSRSEPRSAP